MFQAWCLSSGIDCRFWSFWIRRGVAEDENSVRFWRGRIRPSVRAQRTGRCQTHRPQLRVRLLSVSLLLSRGTQKRRNETFFRRSDAFFQSFPAASRWARSPPCFDLVRREVGDDDDDEHVWTTDQVSLLTHDGFTVAPDGDGDGNGRNIQPASKTVPQYPPSTGSYRATGQGLGGKARETMSRWN